MKQLILLPFTVLLVAVSGDHFFVKEGSQVCIIMDANITGKIYYATTKNETKDYQFNITTVNVNGSCVGGKVSEEQTIEIYFYPNKATARSGSPWILTLWFSHEKTKTFLLKDYAMKAVFYPELFSDTEISRTYIKSEKAQTDVGAEETNGFRCSNSVLGLDSDSTLNLKNLCLIAYANLNETEFLKEQTFEQCAFDARTSEIVPIVVGACLAMLVIVVLIAYLIGRARAKRQGYASV